MMFNPQMYIEFIPSLQSFALIAFSTLSAACSRPKWSLQLSKSLQKVNVKVCCSTNLHTLPWCDLHPNSQPTDHLTHCDAISKFHFQGLKPTCPMVNKVPSTGPAKGQQQELMGGCNMHLLLTRCQDTKRKADC